MKPMDSGTWSRVRGIFREAVELGSAEREKFLQEACASDPGIRAEVDSLLEADASAGDFLGSSAGEFAAELLVSAEQEAEEELASVPPYVLRSVLGRGGMGTVYLAERDDGHFDHKVALKLIPKSRVDADLSRRFLLERQILASLVHPGIARLYDGGITADGRPFFAMEYVEGEGLTRYAQAKELGIDARLALFESVCEAVEYAQQKLVVHRDLKPSNILVDANGQVKLLDFGIAKLLEHPSQTQAAQTRDASHMLTPEYAAPEQLRGEPVSTATDVYSLGAILYELMSGEKPHGEGLAGVISKRLGDEATTRLSEVVSDSRLRGRIRGDVENIVAKALEPDPMQRYGSAAALLDDLRRHRRGLPISATAPSWGYRAGKFVRRNLVALSAATVIVLLLLGSSAAIFRQSKIAEREAHRATEVKDFLLSIFAARDPAESAGEDLRASELLARGSERVREELAEEPELQAEILGELGRIHVQLGDYDAARTHYADALRLRESVGSSGYARAQSLVDLASVAYYQGASAEAESLLRLAEPLIRRRQHPALHSKFLSNLGAVYTMRGEFDAAEPFYLEALRVDREEYGERSLAVATDLANYAVFLGEVGNEEKSTEAIQQAHAIRREILPPDHPELASSLHNLGDALRRLGRLGEAEAAFREAVAIRRRVYEGAHPRLAGSIRSLGQTLQAQDRFEEAEQAFQESHDMSRELMGDQSQDVALALNDLATIAFYRGDLTAAAERFRRAADIFEANLSPSHPTVLTLRSNLATIELQRGAYEAGEYVYEEVLEARREQFGEEHPSVADGVRNVAIARRLRGHSREAVGLFRRALEIYDANYGEEHSESAWTRTRLAEALCDLGEFAEAETLLRASEASLGRLFPDGHRRHGDALHLLGRVLLESGRAQEALGILERAETKLVAQVGVDHRDAVICRFTIALCQLTLGRDAEARAIVRADLARLTECYPEPHPDRRRLEAKLAHLADSR